MMCVNEGPDSIKNIPANFAPIDAKLADIYRSIPDSNRGYRKIRLNARLTSESDVLTATLINQLESEACERMSVKPNFGCKFEYIEL